MLLFSMAFKCIKRDSVMLQEKLYLERDVLLILRRKKKRGYHKIYLKQNQLVQQFSTVHKYCNCFLSSKTAN